MIKMNGTDNPDTLDGAAGVTNGNDSLSGRGGSDLIFGLPGDDTLAGGPGSDTLDGGGGTDLADYGGAPGKVNVNLATSAGYDGETLNGGVIGQDSLIGIEQVRGSAFDDYLAAGNAAATLFGGAGVDAILGGSGADRLLGEGDADSLVGGAGADTLQGGDGADTVMGGPGNDSLDGGNQTDLLTYADAAGKVNVDLKAGTASVSAAGSIPGADHRLSGFEVVRGSDVDDFLGGSDVADTLLGGGGNDTIDALAGADSVEGGGGDDLVIALGADTLSGGEGRDVLGYIGSGVFDLAAGAATLGGAVMRFSGFENYVFFNGSVTMRGSDAAEDLDATVAAGGGSVIGSHELAGGGGADTIRGWEGRDTVEGGAGGDSLSGGNGVDLLSFAGSVGAVRVDLGAATLAGGDAAGDTIAADFENLRGGVGGDTLLGSAIGNAIEGGGGRDLLRGMLGADTLVGGAGADTLQGGNADAARDLASYAGSSAGVLVRLANGAAAGKGGDAEGDALSGIEALGGSGFGDTLQGGWLDGGAGADTLTGGGTADWLVGGDGADTLVGGEGADTLFGADAAGGSLSGRDVASYAGSSVAVRVVLDSAGNGTGAGAHAQGDILRGIDALVGSAFADTLQGSDLAGGTGGDSLQGLAGADTLAGGGGSDTLAGGAGGDRLVGGAGNDVYVTDGADTMVETAGGGLDTVHAAVTHTLGAEFEVLVLGAAGGGGSPRVDGTGNALANVLRGSDENNRLAGLDGADTLQGEYGADTLAGGNGADLLVGGIGGDSMAGNRGNDVFLWGAVWEGGDTISGYVVAEDQLHLLRDGFSNFTFAYDLGVLPTDRLQINASGNTTSLSGGHFIWDVAARTLWWDVDGAGGFTPDRIATFTTMTGSFSAGEIVLV